MQHQAIIEELNRRLDPSARPKSHDFLQIVPKVVCADGFVLSIQASASHYCSPRDSYGPWHQVEVGFPSVVVEAFMPFIDGGEDTDPTTTVYGYVPMEIVAQAIADHGGFASSQKAA